MKATIEHTPNVYGFGHDWTMVITDHEKRKVFWMGQDAKVCARLIGTTPGHVIELIGGNNIDNAKVNRKLVQIIFEALAVPGQDDWKEIMKDVFKTAEPWALAVE